MDTETIGGRVQRLREAKEWSLGELAGRSGIDKGAISRLERGLRSPTPRTVRDLANALGVPPETLKGDKVLS